MSLTGSWHVRRSRWGGTGGITSAALSLILGAIGCTGDGEMVVDGSVAQSADAQPRSGSGGSPSSIGLGGAMATGSGGASAGSGGAVSLGSGGAKSPTGSGGVWQDAAVSTLAFTGVEDVFPNPERGFYRVINLTTDRDFSAIRSAGYSLIFSTINLRDYRTRDLDAALLSSLDAGFAAARKAGVKVVFRFMYNAGPWPNPEPDASEAWITRHLTQVKPVLEKNVDVIAVLQAGLIGAWGEWHSSTNGLLDGATEYRIIEALLAALPVSRSTQIRRPGFKQAHYGMAALTDTEAFDGSIKSRIGHHNDCFLTDPSDYGTYDSGQIESQKTYLSQEGLYTPMGGETCGVFPPRSECASALAEMERLRWSFINNDYHQSVVASWTSGGCRPTMDMRLGYRFQLTSVDAATDVRPGGVLPVTVHMTNVGWAPPYNARPVRVVLSGPTKLVTNLDSVDPRQFKPGTAISFGARLQLPRDMPEGSYTLSLWMPDAADNLAGDPRYSIRFANANVWDATAGTNKLATVTIAESAPGSVDPEATTFVVR